MYRLPELSKDEFNQFQTETEAVLGFKMTDEQTHILKHHAGLIPFDNRSLMVQASPGAGKTSLIVMLTMLMEFMHRNGKLTAYPRVIALAHMRQNRAMLERYLPHWVHKSTVHKLGKDICFSKGAYNMKGAQWRVANITERVLRQTYPMGVPLYDQDGVKRNRDVGDIYWAVSRFISICITSLVRQDNQDGIDWLFARYTPQVDGMTDAFEQNMIQNITPKILQEMDETRRDTGYISFDEMVSIPQRAGWLTRQYDMVLVDELQDTSPAQHVLIEGLGEMVFGVGDLGQAVMKFAGADADAWRRTAHIFDAKVLTMATTQRCPKQVVAHLQSVFNTVKPRSDAIDGSVKTIGSLGEFNRIADKPNTGVICRTHASAAEAYISLMEADIKTPIVVLGADIYNTVKRVVAAMRHQKLVIPFMNSTFMAYVQSYRETELEKARAIKMPAQRDNQIEEVKSNAALVSMLWNFFECDIKDFVDIVGMRFGTTPDDIYHKQRLFDQSVVIGTAHAWKGLEVEAAIVFNTEDYVKEAQGDDQWREILFVAMSRSQRDLIFYPQAPVTPVKEIDYDVVYEASVNKKLPYPGFDTSLFSREIEFEPYDGLDEGLWGAAFESEGDTHDE